MVVYIIYKSKVVKALHGVTRRIEQERHHHLPPKEAGNIK